MCNRRAAAAAPSPRTSQAWACALSTTGAVPHVTGLPRARRVRGVIGPAPRAVPRRLVLRLLFGMRGAQLLWAFPIAGMIVALTVQQGRRTYRGTALATITSVTDTGRRDDDDEVYVVRFDLLDAQGRHHTGSFETTHSVEPGQRELQYDPDSPSDARLPGGLGERGTITLGALLFAFAAFAGELGLIARGRSALQLLRFGEPTTGKLVDKQPGDDTPDRLTFEYSAAGKLRRIVVSGSDPRIEDDAEEPMLYDTKDPDRAVTVDNLPGQPEIRPDGSLASRPGLGVHVLVLPAIFISLTLAWLVEFVRF